MQYRIVSLVFVTVTVLFSTFTSIPLTFPLLPYISTEIIPDAASTLFVLIKISIADILMLNVDVLLAPKIPVKSLLFYLLLYAPFIYQFPFTKGSPVLYNAPSFLTYTYLICVIDGLKAVKMASAPFIGISKTMLFVIFFHFSCSSVMLTLNVNTRLLFTNPALLFYLLPISNHEVFYSRARGAEKISIFPISINSNCCFRFNC